MLIVSQKMPHLTCLSILVLCLFQIAKFLLGKPRRVATSFVTRETARRGASLREALV